MAEVILGLNDIHSQNYIYRDLKPENIMLDLDGHIRIVDFGLAKKVQSLMELNYSFCGTYDLTAPEVGDEKGYNCMVDYYNIGTLVYELVTREIPVFIGKTRRFLPEGSRACMKLSDELKDFMKGLLNSNPQKRLGAKNGLNEVRAHPWLKSINFEEIRKKRGPSPLWVDPFSIKFNHEKVKLENIEMMSAKAGRSKINKRRNIPEFDYQECHGAIVSDHKWINLLAEASIEEEEGGNTRANLQKGIKSICIAKSNFADEFENFCVVENEDGSPLISKKVENYQIGNIRSLKTIF